VNDTLLIALIAGVAALLVLGIVFLVEFTKKRPSRYYGFVERPNRIVR